MWLSRMRLFAAWLLLAQPALSQSLGKIKGRISIPHKFQEITSSTGSGLAAARVILDGGLMSALPASDGHFALSGVPAGPHLLQVVHPLLSFDPVRVEYVPEKASGQEISAFIADMEHGKGVKLKYPLGLAPSGAFSYLEKREEFNLLSVFKSPYAIFGVVSMGAMFFLPKLQSMVEEEKERQQQELQQSKTKKLDD
mmetsp:Transcript_32366/g.60927  ORF Transcript_32366/g.60927 Transcript_32366/m.60927 type:complete len:197 (-) Transcript_32366:54-644(-)